MAIVEPSFSRPRRTGLHRDLVDALGRRIVTGDIAPGELLAPEPGQNVGMDVSRSVAREAIKVLAAKGLVEPRPKVGTRVLPRSSWNLFDPDVLSWSLDASDAAARYEEIHEVRTVIEPRAAALSAERRTPEEAQRLRELLAAMEAGINDRDAWVAADLDLHAAILAATHNALLAQLADMVRLVLDECQKVSGRVAGTRGRAIEEHRAVVEAITNGDPAAAARATEALLASAIVDLRDVLGTLSDARPQA